MTSNRADDVKSNDDIVVSNNERRNIDTIREGIANLTVRQKEELAALGTNYFMNQDYYKEILHDPRITVSNDDMDGTVATIDIVEASIREEMLAFNINMDILQKIVNSAPEFKAVLEETNGNALSIFVSSRIKCIVDKMTRGIKDKPFIALLAGFLIVITGNDKLQRVEMGLLSVFLFFCCPFHNVLRYVLNIFLFCVIFCGVLSGGSKQKELKGDMQLFIKKLFTTNAYLSSDKFDHIFDFLASEVVGFYRQEILNVGGKDTRVFLRMDPIAEAYQLLQKPLPGSVDVTNETAKTAWGIIKPRLYNLHKFLCIFGLAITDLTWKEKVC